MAGIAMSEFRARFFSETSDEQWSDWRWQMQHRFRTCTDFERVLDLSAEERAAFDAAPDRLPLAVTPYMMELMWGSDSTDPIRRTMVPVADEFVRAEGEVEDPLGEDAHRPERCIVHTYPDKVLFLVTDHCATYCRYCTRARMVGRGELPPDRSVWEAGLAYIREHEEVRDVLLSGGDPLTLSDDRLDWLLERLHAIDHVEMIRIGSKVPAVLPQRITPDLVNVLRRYHPLWMSIHFTHPAELTPECAQACERLADAGIPLGGQTVLLKGVNDDPAVMRRLMLGLLKIRVKPYYLHQCDAIVGSSHFRTPVSVGQDIIRALHGHTSGYAVPAYMIDAPGGGGKVPVGPNYVESVDDGVWTLQNYAGDTYHYHEGQALVSAQLEREEMDRA